MQMTSESKTRIALGPEDAIQTALNLQQQRKNHKNYCFRYQISEDLRIWQFFNTNGDVKSPEFAQLAQELGRNKRNIQDHYDNRLKFLTRENISQMQRTVDLNPGKEKYLSMQLDAEGKLAFRDIVDPKGITNMYVPPIPVKEPPPPWTNEQDQFTAPENLTPLQSLALSKGLEILAMRKMLLLARKFSTH